MNRIRIPVYTEEESIAVQEKALKEGFIWNDRAEVYHPIRRYPYHLYLTRYVDSGKATITWSGFEYVSNNYTGVSVEEYLKEKALPKLFKVFSPPGMKKVIKDKLLSLGLSEWSDPEDRDDWFFVDLYDMDFLIDIDEGDTEHVQISIEELFALPLPAPQIKSGIIPDGLVPDWEVEVFLDKVVVGCQVITKWDELVEKVAEIRKNLK